MLVIAVLLLAACSPSPPGEPAGAVAEPAPQTVLPDVAFDGPLPGEMLPSTGGVVTFHAYHAEGISAVELALGGQPLSGVVQPEPGQPLVVVQYTWVPPGSGSYTLEARAQSAVGDWSAPATLEVTVSNPPSETPPPLPSPTSQSTQTPTPTRTIVRTNTPTMTLTHAPTTPPQTNEVFFLYPSYTTTLIFKGANSCGPHMTEVLITATHPEGINYILLYYRLISHQGFDTPWRFHKMQVEDETTYRSIINAQDIIDYNKGVIQYQFVAEDVNGEITRSRRYSNIDMAYCE
jgi:hypothetical protein